MEPRGAEPDGAAREGHERRAAGPRGASGRHLHHAARAVPRVLAPDLRVAGAGGRGVAGASRRVADRVRHDVRDGLPAHDRLQHLPDDRGLRVRLPRGVADRGGRDGAGQHGGLRGEPHRALAVRAPARGRGQAVRGPGPGAAARRALGARGPAVLPPALQPEQRLPRHHPQHLALRVRARHRARLPQAAHPRLRRQPPRPPRRVR